MTAPPSGGLWNRLAGPRAPGGAPGQLPTPPPGGGPLVWLRLDAAQPPAGGPPVALAEALARARPDLRLVVTHPAGGALPPDGRDGPPPPAADPGASPEAARRAFEHLAPAALVLLGSELPEALLAEAERRRLPVFALGVRLDHLPPPPFWGRGRSRGALARVGRWLLPDAAARDAALRLGVAAERIVVTGPLAETRPPPRGAEAERVVLAAALRGRQLWLAAAVPEAEEAAVLAAHRQALGHAHRALLLLAPAEPARAGPIAAALETEGVPAAIRSQTDEPASDIQVLVADDPHELGLWYRLAPVSYLGGTLSGQDAAARHPFEPAALGSAILHGPRTARFAAAWDALALARATRGVDGPDELGTALEELLAPDRAAVLASRAWSVCTAGAEVARRIAEAVSAALPPPPA